MLIVIIAIASCLAYWLHYVYSEPRSRRISVFLFWLVGLPWCTGVLYLCWLAWAFLRGI